MFCCSGIYQSVLIIIPPSSLFIPLGTNMAQKNNHKQAKSIIILKLKIPAN